MLLLLLLLLDEEDDEDEEEEEEEESLSERLVIRFQSIASWWATKISVSFSSVSL